MNTFFTSIFFIVGAFIIGTIASSIIFSLLLVLLIILLYPSKKESSLKTCEACGKGKLHPKVHTEEITNRNGVKSFSYSYSKCDFCGAQLADASDLKYNIEQYKKFKENG